MNTSDIAPEESRRRAVDSFWEIIPPLWGSVRNHLRSIAADKYNITVEQFHILRHIRRGVTTVSELAAVKQISRPAISQSVDLLVDRGLITRCPVEGDRRCVQLALTPNGDEMLNDIFSENRDWMISILNSASPDDLNQMIVGLDLLKGFFTTNAPK